uniref:E3 ubiquitin protein ligase n=1 Tax=Candidozyma auris TaxID=498019 RepID=A0A0L0NRA1_CANAR
MEAEDKKRPFSLVEPDVFTKSKKPLHELSEDGPLTQQDVLYFKKEAIWRQMRFYKLQADQLQLELSKYEKRYQNFVAAHQLLEAWYSQILKSCNLEEEPQIDLSASTSSIQEALEARTAKLADLLKSVDSDGSGLRDLLKLEGCLAASQKQKEDLEEKLAELQNELTALRKLKDRTELATLQRIQSNSLAKTEEAEPSNGKHDKDGSIENGNVDASDTVVISTADKEELEQLRIQAEELKAAIETSKQSLEKMSRRLEGAETYNQSLKERLSNLTDEDLSKSSKFVELVTQNKSLQESLAQTSKFQQELVDKVKALEEKDGNYSKLVDQELADENTRLKETLSRSENDLARIRAIRDELLAKQTILNSEMENKKTNAAVNELNRVLSERLSKLEKTREEEYEGKEDSNLHSLSKEELIKRLHILSSEVKEIEAAFQQTRSLSLDKLKETIDNEGLMKKLTIEKNKADQKYFASMRVKDSLSAENKVLKSQIAKSQELILKFNETEKAYLSKIEILTKSVNDYKVIKEMSIQENTQLQKNLKMLNKTRDNLVKELSDIKQEAAELKKQNGGLTNEMNAKSMACSKLEAKLRATESLLQKYKQNNTSSILEEDEKQLEALRSITKCSVCLKNWKNTAITACGHVFCDGCVQERLAARLRRCPTCNKGFSSNDLLSIHL